MSYVLYKVRYKQGNLPIEQTTVEVKDRGSSRQNRDAAQALAEVWIAERRAAKGYDLRFIDAEPFVAMTERPDDVKPDGAAKASIKPLST